MFTPRIDIAFSALSLETREVDGANFRYGKVFGLPFFSVGMLDLPPGGFKRTKNCRKMHMAFFVATGKVNVDVGETNFTISKGGVWQVPRGQYVPFFHSDPLSPFASTILVLFCVCGQP